MVGFKDVNFKERNMGNEVLDAMVLKMQRINKRQRDYVDYAIKDKSVYLSGPVTGLDRHSVERAFNAVERLLYELGAVDVFNPIKEIPEGTDWVEAMLVCLDAIADKTYSTIVFLPGWRLSNGCRIEAHHALLRDDLDIFIWEYFYKDIHEPKSCLMVWQDHDYGLWWCSSCGAYHKKESPIAYDYCPHCGAKTWYYKKMVFED